MKKGPHKMMLESSRYDKWDRDRGGGGGGAGGGVGGGGGSAGGGAGASGGPWPGRDRERDRERERQARASQMYHAHAAEPDESSLFSAPFRVTGSRDSVSQQIQTKLGDYHLAQCFIEDPSKSIGICAEPPSPAPCPPSRRESEFKKPAHTMMAPQNGRVLHRAYPYKSDGPSSTGAPAHRPPPLRMPNGLQPQSVTDSSQPPIESILKEMKSLPTPLTVIAATPRKEAENKFIFNHYTNKVQENPQITNTDLKAPITKPGLDNRISNSRSSVSPSSDVVNKDLGLSESDDEVAAAGHRLGPPLSPIGSNSPSSGSSSQSDSESESSSAESSAAPPAPAAPAPVAPSAVPAAPAPPAPAAPTSVAPSAPAQRSSWSLVNFVPAPAQPPEQQFDSGNKLRHVLADVKGKSSPISEMSDSEASSPSPVATRRRRSIANRISAASSDEDTPRHTTNSPRVPVPSAPAPQKRGRPPKVRNPDERPAKRGRGRPPKTRPPSPPPAPAAAPPSPPPDSDVEPDPPAHHPTQQDTKTHIFRKVFTPKKVDECGGKGGKGGKGKGGKGKGQVTIIEVTAPPESGADDDDRRYRERSNERRNEEALARVSPPREPESVTRRREADRIAQERIQERVAIERADHRRSADRIDRSITERTSNDRIPPNTFERIPTERPVSDRIPSDRLSSDRIPTERTSNDRIPSERSSNDRLSDRLGRDRTPSERLSNDRIPRERTPNDRLSDRMMIERVPSERITNERLMAERIPERMTIDRVSNERMSNDRLSERMAIDRTPTDRLERPSVSERLSTERLSGGLSSDRHNSDRLSGEKNSFDRSEKLSHDRLSTDKSHERVPSEKNSHDRLAEKMSMSRLPDNRMSIDRLADSKMSIDRLPENKIDRLTDSSKMDRLTDSKMSIDRLTESKMSIDRLTDSKMSIDRLTESKMSIDRLTDSKAPMDRVERVPVERYVKAEADVGSGIKSGRGSERLEEASSNVVERRRSRVLVRIPLSRLRAELLGSLQRRSRPAPPPHHHTSVEVATNHERSGASTEPTPIYFSYFERLPADALSDEERDHKYYLDEATRLRNAAEREQEPLARVMLYLESVLCFVLTGRVLELELDTKGAFTVYRETIEYIKSIHSMPQRFRASPHDTFNKLDILSLRVQALLYLRMFKMYNREVKEYNKIVTEYQQKPALAESVSPLSPTPSPAGSVGSVGSGSASSGYCSLAHSVPAHAHTALLLLTKYYAFLYVAHDLWEQADSLCRLRANQDLFISVDRKCGPLSLSSTFRHLVQYVRYAISLLKNAQTE